jgi:hypothetical protein
MLELRNKVINVPAYGEESVISPISKDGFGGYQLYEDIYFDHHNYEAVAEVVVRKERLMLENEYNAGVVAAIIAAVVSIINFSISIAINHHIRKKDNETEQRKQITNALTNFYMPLTRHLDKLKICLQNYLATDESSTFGSLIEELAGIKESLGKGIKATHDVKHCVSEIELFMSKENFVYIDHCLLRDYSLIDRFIATLNMAIKEKLVSSHYDFNIDIIDCFIKSIDSVFNDLTVNRLVNNPTRRKK